MIVLGIESSCDETAAAIVADDPACPDGPGRILAHVVRSQIDDHDPYGGVVPEIAARAHLDHVEPVVARCLAEAGLDLADLDGIAATVGPGLIGGLIVGASFAKGLALAADKPFIAVNHLEGHALTCRLSLGVRFPFLLLLVSGGHCQLALARGVGDWLKLGGSIDDAVGEAFDKTAKMLGLGFPGGPAVERAAVLGDPRRFTLPRPMVGRPNCDFSFSGLKTAVRHAAEAIVAADGGISDQDAADLSAAFQQAVADSLADRVGRAIGLVGAELRAAHPDPDPPPALVVAGGVAANQTLRARLTRAAAAGGLRLIAPPLELCTDNGAMIAWAGLERLKRGGRDGLDAPCRPRWPLETLKA